MNITIHKVFFAWESDEEEEWLNEMSKKGFHLIYVGLFKYIFEKGVPGEYQYRLEMLNHFPNHPESISYIQFFEETGAEKIGSILKWVYFRKKVMDTSQKVNGYFEIFSDKDSRLNHLRKIKTLLIPVCILELGVGSYYIILGLVYKISLFFILSIFLFLIGIFIYKGVKKISKKIKYWQQ